MTDITNLSERDINDYANASVRLVDNITIINGETITRPLDSGDVMELQQSKLTTISNHAAYELSPIENIGTFTFTIRDTNLERAIRNRERNDNYPDEVSAEFVIGRESSWVASTINNGKHLRRNIGYVSHDDYSIEIKSEGSKTVINVVFTGE